MYCIYILLVGKLPEALSTFAALKRVSPNATIVVDGEEFYKEQAPESDWTIREVWLLYNFVNVMGVAFCRPMLM